MIILKSSHLTMFDVDDTLRMWGSGKPHVAMIEQLKAHHNAGHSIGVWSKGGYKWAAKVVQELGIQEYVTVILEKPHWIYDDKPIQEGLMQSQYIPYKDVTSEYTKT